MTGEEKINEEPLETAGSEQGNAELCEQAKSPEELPESTGGSEVGFLKGIFVWVKDIIVAILIAILVIQFIKPTIVKESSMEPTLYANNYLFLSKQAYTLFSEPKHGDIVVFHTTLTTADGKEKLLIKRVIGLPGDQVAISDGQVYINGEAISEPYLKDGYTPGYLEPMVVPQDSLFVMGDNRVVSIDSRSETVGCVKISEIVGKAFLRLYPFDEIRTF